MRKTVLSLSFIFCSFILCSQPVNVTFSVNMSYQIQTGHFDPAIDYVDIAGDFNGWGEIEDKLSNIDNDDWWEVTLTFNQGTTLNYKLRLNGVWDGNEEFAGGGPNRGLVVGAADTTVSFWYSDIEPSNDPPTAKIKAVTNVALAGGSVNFSSDSEGFGNQYEWFFEGGTPEVSADPSVHVTYENPGVYDVYLKVSNDSTSDSTLLTDYITVVEDDRELGWWNETVFYEIFVRSFYDSDGDGIGDFNGITEKLDYLNDGDPNTTDDLGITGIWLMPINESPSYHGYDVIDYRAVESDYGTMEDFKNMVEACHDRGIKVIIDLVLNHSSTESPWFRESQTSVDSEFRNWYRWSDTNPAETGPWGQTVWHEGSSGYYYGLFWGGMPDLNYDEPALKEEMMAVSRFWLEEVGIDGYRLDAVKYIHEEENALEDLISTHEFWEDFNREIKAAKENAFSVGEAWTSTEKVFPYVVNDRLDICFDFDLSYRMIDAANNGSMNTLREQVEKVVDTYPYQQFGTFSTNHDMTRVFDELGQDESKMKLVAATYLLLPGVPFIYYGEELGMLGRKPDENIRRPFSWSAEAHAGFSSRTPWNSPATNFETHNVASESDREGSLLSWYRNLIHLRNQEEAIQKGSYQEIQTGNDNLLAFVREYEDEQVLVVLNGSSIDINYAINLEGIDFTGFELPALEDQLTGDVIEVSSLSEDLSLAIERRGVKVFKRTNFVPTKTSLRRAKFAIYPNPANEVIHFSLESYSQVTSCKILTKLGQTIFKSNDSSISSIDISGLNPGLYLMEITLDNSEKYVKKIIVQ